MSNDERLIKDLHQSCAMNNEDIDLTEVALISAALDCEQADLEIYRKPNGHLLKNI